MKPGLDRMVEATPKPRKLTNAERAAIRTQDQVVKGVTIAVTLVIAAFIIGVTIGRGSC